MNEAPVELTTPPNGEGLKLYDPAYVKALEDQVVLLKMQNGIAAQLQPELEKLRAALPSTATTRKQVFMNEVMAADLEKLLNDGYEKWHAEFKGSKLYVVLVRDIPAEPTPDPAGARHTSPEAEPSKPAARQPDAIIDNLPVIEASPLEKEILGEPVMSVAERYMETSRQRIQTAFQLGFSHTLHLLDHQRALVPTFGGDSW